MRALAIKWLDAKEMVVSLFTFVPSATRGQMYNPCIRTDVVLAPLLPHYFQMYKNAHLHFTSLLKCEPKLPKILVFVCQFVQPWLEVRSCASSSTASAHFPFCVYTDFCTWIHAFLYIWPQVLEWQAPRQKGSTCCIMVNRYTIYGNFFFLAILGVNLRHFSLNYSTWQPLIIELFHDLLLKIQPHVFFL